MQSSKEPNVGFVGLSLAREWTVQAQQSALFAAKNYRKLIQSSFTYSVIEGGHACQATTLKVRCFVFQLDRR